MIFIFYNNTAMYYTQILISIKILLMLAGHPGNANKDAYACFRSYPMIGILFVNVFCIGLSMYFVFNSEMNVSKCSSAIAM